MEYEPKYSGSFIGSGKAMSGGEVCRILSDLVSCDSTFGHETACGNLIRALAEKEGLAAETIPCTENRFDVLLTYGAPSWQSVTHGLLLHGHYDTVPALDMEDPFRARTEGNYLYGRGAVDQKSGLAAAIAAVIAVRRAGLHLRKPVCAACVIDEESEHRGSYALSKSGIRADYAIVTEPTDCREIDFGCLGTTPIRIRVTGKTAHASNPGEGINAIEKSLPVLRRLVAMRFPAADLGELGSRPGTLCVSKMDAGTAYNNVPGEAVIWMDRRTVPGENARTALQQVREVIAEAKKEVPDLMAEAEIARPDWHWDPIREHGLNPTLTDLSCPLYGVMKKAAAECGLPVPQKGFFWGYTDMDFLVNDLHIPTLVYGPGDGRMAHSAVEKVDLEEVCRTADLFCRTIQELCSDEGDICNGQV